MTLMDAKPEPKSGLFALSLILSLSLVACGGGGGDTSPVLPASYQAGQAELGALKVLQDARTLCGFGAVTRQAQLDAAALSHAKYLVDLSFATGQSIISHEETPGVAGFTGVFPWDRALFQGYNYQGLAEILEATVWDYSLQPSFPTLEERGADAMRILLNSVYHLSGAMYEGSDIGLGAYMKTVQISGGRWREEFRFGALNGYRSNLQRITLGAGNVVSYPCQGSSLVPTTFSPAEESPNPFLGTAYASALVGPPIYLKADAPQQLALNALGSSITENGNTVPFAVLNAGNDPNTDQVNNRPYIGSNEVFVIPTTPLKPGTSYQVTLNGTINSLPFTRTFTMTTGL